MLSENFLCLFPSWWHHGQGKWQNRFKAHRLSYASFPCFKYSLSQKTLFLSFVWSQTALCLELCNQARLRREKDGWGRKHWERERQRNVATWSQPGKRDKQWSHPPPPLGKPWNTIGSTWVPSSGEVGDQHCMTIILAGTCCHCLLQLMTNRKRLKKPVCLRWWYKSLTSFCCCDSIWISKSMTLKCCDIFKATKQLWGTKCKYFKQHGEIEIWQKECSEWLWR